MPARGLAFVRVQPGESGRHDGGAVTSRPDEPALPPDDPTQVNNPAEASIPDLKGTAPASR